MMEPAVFDGPAGECILRKFPHFHRIFQGGAGSPDARRIGGSAYRDDFKIQPGCEAPVQAQFFFAEMFSEFQ